MASETKHTIEILDAKYKKANLVEIASENCGHLSTMQRNKLLHLLSKYEKLFDRTSGDFKTDPIKFKTEVRC